jgi:hypothetical protein
MDSYCLTDQTNDSLFGQSISDLNKQFNSTDKFLHSGRHVNALQRKTHVNKHKDSVRTAQETRFSLVIKTNQWKFFLKIKVLAAR